MRLGPVGTTFFVGSKKVAKKEPFVELLNISFYMKISQKTLGNGI